MLERPLVTQDYFPETSKGMVLRHRPPVLSANIYFGLDIGTIKGTFRPYPNLVLQLGLQAGVGDGLGCPPMWYTLQRATYIIKTLNNILTIINLGQKVTGSL